MEKLITQIKEFNHKFHTVDPKKPTVDIDPDYGKLRQQLMKEELQELIEGMENKDLENIAKESADLLYVLMGTVSAYGLLDRFSEIFTEVHRSNMSKTYIEGQGKPAKLKGYKKANLAGIIN